MGGVDANPLQARPASVPPPATISTEVRQTGPTSSVEASSANFQVADQAAPHLGTEPTWGFGSLADQSASAGDLASHSNQTGEATSSARVTDLSKVSGTEEKSGEPAESSSEPSGPKPVTVEDAEDDAQ